jgi:hypothetical protein
LRTGKNDAAKKIYPASLPRAVLMKNIFRNWEAFFIKILSIDLIATGEKHENFSA